jgi:hypothetical protein
VTEPETIPTAHEADAKSAEPESLRLELQEAIATFRHQAGLLIQAFGVILTADSVLLAYGFAQRKSGILLLASLMPLVNVLLYFAIISGMIPIAFAALRMEQRLLLEDALMSTWLRVRYDLPFHFLPDLSLVSEPEVRDKLLRSPWYLVKGDPKVLALVGAFAGQFVIFWISVCVYHYRFM